MHAEPGMTAAELAACVGGTLVGDGARRVRGVAPLTQAGPDELSWLGSAKYLPKLAASRAGVVLMPTSAPVPDGRTVIQVPDPDVALCEALRWLAPAPPRVPQGIDGAARVAADACVEGAALGPHVFVGPRATVGPGTQLHAGVYVGEGATIGCDCVLWPNVVVRERTTIGDRVIIHANATLGADGFSYLWREGRHVKVPQVGRVVIEDDVEIGANTCIDRARSGETRIGRGTKIDNLVQIAHNVHIGSDTIIVAQCGIAGSTTIGKQVMLGGQTGAIDHLHIGDGVQMAAKSVAFDDIPAGQKVRGIPAVPTQQFGRDVLNVRRLGELVAEVRRLRKRVEQLESTADD